MKYKVYYIGPDPNDCEFIREVSEEFEAPDDEAAIKVFKDAHILQGYLMRVENGEEKLVQLNQ